MASVWLITFAPDPSAVSEHAKTEWRTLVVTEEPSQSVKDAAHSVVEIPLNEGESLDVATIPDAEEVEPRTWVYPEPETREPSNIIVDLEVSDGGSSRNIQETLEVQFARLWGGEYRVTVVCSDIGYYASNGAQVDTESQDETNESVMTPLCSGSTTCRDFSTGSTYHSYLDISSRDCKIRKTDADSNILWVATISDTNDPVENLSWMGPGRGACGDVTSVSSGNQAVICLGADGSLLWTHDVVPSDQTFNVGDDPPQSYTNAIASGVSADYDGNVYFLRLSYKNAGDGLSWWLFEFVCLSHLGAVTSESYLDISSAQPDADEGGRTMGWRPACLLCAGVPEEIFGDPEDMELGFYGGGGAYGVCIYSLLDTELWVWTYTHRLCRVSAGGGYAGFVSDMQTTESPSDAQYTAVAVGPGTWGVALSWSEGGGS